MEDAMAKPEAVFIRYINTRINNTIHAQSMYTPYSSGTPDNYYEAYKQTLWIEYKFEHKIPKIYHLDKKVSSLQKAWLNRAVDNKQRAWVVTGFGTDQVAVFIDKTWNTSHPRETIKLMTRKEYIELLNNTLLTTQ